MTKEQMKGLNVYSLVSLLNETTDPYCGCIVGGEVIHDNTEETLERLTEDWGWTGYWVAHAIEVGRFRTADKFIMLWDDPHEIFTFSTAEGLSEKMDGENIMELLNDYWWREYLDADLKSRLSGIALPLHEDRGDSMLDFEDRTDEWWNNLTDMEKFSAYEETLY